jgi:hypothetical protein
MQKYFLLIFLFGFLSFGANAQKNKGLLIVGALDAFKTDNQGIGQKTQLGLEANYFLISKFALTGGYEMWSESVNHVVLGARFYPINPVFVRFRGLISNNADVSLGMGFSKGISNSLRMEIGGDYFANSKALAIRIGLGFSL